MDEREGRIGLNEATFREVNERLGALNEAFSVVVDTMVAVCECGDPSCIERIRVDPGDYERMRQDPLLFIVRPGHESPDVETVVAARGEYHVIRKHERDGIDDLAEATAPER